MFMKNLNNYELAQMSKRVINSTLQERIPSILQPYNVDDNPDVISQLDLFGNIDQFNIIGTKLYAFQHKSRNLAYEDICVECIAYRGPTYDPVSGKKEVPISGAFYYKEDKIWLVPNYKQMEVFTAYLPRVNFVGVFSRFILDVLFADGEVWKLATGIQCINTDSDRYCVFFNYKKFVEAYLSCVVKITTGNDVSLKSFCDKLILAGNAVDNEMNIKRGKKYCAWSKRQNYQQEESFF